MFFNSCVHIKYTSMDGHFTNHERFPTLYSGQEHCDGKPLSDSYFLLETLNIALFGLISLHQ